MRRVRTGQLPWINLDGLHRIVFNGLLRQFEIEGLSEQEIDQLNRGWHRLTPWSDSVAGLSRLKARYVLSTLSNGHVALLVDMAKNGPLVVPCGN